jgi:hypothetical protein
MVELYLWSPIRFVAYCLIKHRDSFTFVQRDRTYRPGTILPCDSEVQCRVDMNPPLDYVHTPTPYLSDAFCYYSPVHSWACLSFP